MTVGRTPAACNLVDIMLKSEDNWSAVCNMATIVRENGFSQGTGKCPELQLAVNRNVSSS